MHCRVWRPSWRLAATVALTVVTHFVVSLYCAVCGFKAPVFWPKVCLGSEPPSKARLPPACLSQNMFLFINAVVERFVGWFAECEWANGVNVIVIWSVFVVLLLIRSVLFYNPVITWKKYLNGLSKSFIYQLMHNRVVLKEY